MNTLHILLSPDGGHVLEETSRRLGAYATYSGDGVVVAAPHQTWTSIFKQLDSKTLFVWNASCFSPFKEALSLQSVDSEANDVLFGVRYLNKGQVQLKGGLMSYLWGKLLSKLICLVRGLPLSDHRPICIYAQTDLFKSALSDCHNVEAVYDFKLIKKLCTKSHAIRQVPVMWRDA